MEWAHSAGELPNRKFAVLKHMLGGETLSRDIIKEVHQEMVTLTNIYCPSWLWRVCFHLIRLLRTEKIII